MNKCARLTLVKIPYKGLLTCHPDNNEYVHLRLIIMIQNITGALKDEQRMAFKYAKS